MRLNLARPRIAAALVAGKEGDPPTRLLLLREGDLGWQNMEGVSLDADQAGKIIETFKTNGVDVPIDWEHATTASTDEDPKPAPAVGWIKDLAYVPGQGLYAEQIEWVDKAAVDAIRARHYKYYSPVILTDPKTKKIKAIHSMALTNKPRTKNCRELLEAAKARLEAAGVDIMFGDEGENTEQKQVELAALLRTLGADIDEHATLGDVLDAALDMLGVGDEPPDEDSKEPDMADDKKEKKDEGKAPAPTPDVMELAKLTSELGSTAKDLGELKKEFAELQVKAVRHDELQKRVETLETERQNAKVAALIGEQIESGKLNPHDEKAMAAAKKLAATDAEAFTALYAGMTAILPQGKEIEKGRSDARGVTIAKARSAYAANPEVALGAKCEYYVNACLAEAGLAPLNKAERESIEKGA